MRSAIELAAADEAARFDPFPLAAVEQSIAQRLEQIARRHAERLALESQGRALTYGELNRAANRIAHALLERRGEGQEPIAVLMDRSAASLAAALALAKAGKIYVPLDPSFPEQRLAGLLADCRPPLLLASTRCTALARALGDHSCEALDVEGIAARGPDEDPDLKLSPDALAYLLYTSGSTGQPKAVCHSHLGLLHQVMRHTNALRICAADRVAMLGSASAAQANTQLWVTLLNGAALFPKDLKQDGLAGLAAWLTRNGITCARMSTSVFRHWAAHLSGTVCPTLRLVGIGGEPVHRQDVELFRSRFPPDCRLVITFSSTETGTICVHVVDPGTRIGAGEVPVGHPVDDVEVFLVDDSGREVAAGEIGEIAVRSRGVAVGYWTPTGVIRSDFTPHPDDERLRSYRTGDLGQQGPDGTILHHGRKDSVIKIAGHRVDVGEVESELLSSGMLRAVAVADREDPVGTKRLVAYVVPDPERPLDRLALRRFLASRLPEYMIPSRFERIDELPLTASGKIDRRALPAPADSSPGRQRASDNQLGILGTQLRDIWEELLGVRDFGPQDEFVDLGGDSLLGIEMLLRIEKLCGRTLTPSRLLGGPITIDRLVQILLEDEQANFAQPLNALQTGGSRPPLFFLHGDHWHGGLYCHSLARCLGADQPFYAVTPHGLDGDALPWSIEAMARDRLAAVRAVQPTGPYRLGGFCTGGVIAFEMARQLEALGERVDTLLLVDATLLNASLSARLIGRGMRRLAAGLGWSESTRRELYLRLRDLPAAWADGARSGRWGRTRFVAEKLRALPRYLRALHGYLGTSLAREAQPAELHAGTRTHAAQHLAYGVRRRDYLPGRFGGRIALFRSDYLRDKPPQGPTAGWCHVCAAVDVHHLPGTHESVVTRDVALLAEKMKPYLGV
jgi:amino acid adenylation domain-containing protein